MRRGMAQNPKQDIDPAYRRFKLLAHAIAGKPVTLTFINESNGSSYADNERIYLVRDRDQETLRLELMVQAALVAGQSLQRRDLLKLVGKQDLRNRYLLLEVMRCCRAIGDRLPGSFMEALEPFETRHMPRSSEQSLQIAGSLSKLPAPPDWFGTVRPWKILRSSQPGCRSKIGEQRLGQLESKLKKISQDEDEDEDSLIKTSLWKKFTSPLGRDSFLSRLMKEVMNMKTSPHTDSSDSGVSISSDMVSGRMLKKAKDVTHAVRSSLSNALLPSFAQLETSGDSYPEWDCTSRTFRPNWTRVEEVNPCGQGFSYASERLAKVGDRDFQRELAKICLSHQRHRGLPLGDDLVLDRLINLAIDLESGHSGDENIYAASLKTKRDLGVQILLDVSNSTLERSHGGARVIDAQVQAARKICRAFCMLGDRVALHAFHSWGPKLVRFQILKSFHERHVHALDHRLHKLLVAGYTRCGAAIRHATKRLETLAGTPFQLLILISDGYAYDDEYEGEYAVNDTRKAIEEAHARGVAVVCVAVGSDADEKRLAGIYGKANFLSVNNLEHLPAKLGKVVTSALSIVLTDSAGAQCFSTPTKGCRS